jgi:hypothetical protein
MPDPTPESESDAPDLAALVPEPCLLAEDILAIGLAEREHWQRHASTAEHSLGKADWSLPFLVVRTHLETIDGVELLFVLLAMRHEDEDQTGAIFGEFACTPALYEQHVKTFGLERPVPREAEGPVDGMPTPAELNDHAWTALLTGGDPDDEDSYPF